VPPDRPSGVDPATHDQRHPRRSDDVLDELLAEEKATATAIYGIIVSSAVMASAHENSVLKVAVAVLVTLLVYWAAERFAHVMGERIVHSPDARAGLRSHLGSGWELVSASFLPLGVLLGAGLLGLSVDDAVLVALLCATALLFAAGWRVGREAALSTSSRLVSGLTSGAFGAAMIVLKSLLH
jgi:hypothetical protein